MVFVSGYSFLNTVALSLSLTLSIWLGVESQERTVLIAKHLMIIQKDKKNYNKKALTANKSCVKIWRGNRVLSFTSCLVLTKEL